MEGDVESGLSEEKPEAEMHVPSREIVGELRNQEPADREDDQQEDPLADIGTRRRAHDHSDIRSRLSSAPGQRILQPTLRVEVVPATRQLERTEIGVVILAVIADGLDDVVAPGVVDSEQLAEIALEAEEPAGLGVLRFRLDLVDIGLGD